MTLKTLAVIVFVLGSGLATASENARRATYHLTSLDGKECVIHIRMEYAGRRFSASLDGKKWLNFCTFEFSRDETRILAGKFLDLQGFVPVGSGEGMDRHLILCVSGDTLKTALNMAGRYELDNSEYHSLWELKLDSLKQSGNGYAMSAVEYDTVQSKLNPKENHELVDTLDFLFEPNLHVFFTNWGRPAGRFTIEGASSSQMARRPKDEIFPEIRLKVASYFFVEGYWRVLSQKKVLEKYWGECGH